MSHSETPPVQDQGRQALELLLDSKWKTSAFVRDEAIVRSNVAAAQQTKAGNLIAFLNSDRRYWSVADENLVRAYLGLVPTSEQEREADEARAKAEAKAEAAAEAAVQKEAAE